MKQFFVIFLIGLIGCNVTSKSIFGTYQETSGKNIVLNADSTCKIDVEEGKFVSGSWRIKSGYIIVNILDEHYKYLNDYSFRLKGKRIITPDTHMWHHNVMLVYKKK